MRGCFSNCHYLTEHYWPMIVQPSQSTINDLRTLRSRYVVSANADRALYLKSDNGYDKTTMVWPTSNTGLAPFIFAPQNRFFLLNTSSVLKQHVSVSISTRSENRVRVLGIPILTHTHTHSNVLLFFKMSQNKLYFFRTIVGNIIRNASFI